MLSFFNEINGDASRIIWSHAVNSKQKLINSLKSIAKFNWVYFFSYLTLINQIGNSMFLEADILKIDDKHSEPIMAHPPNTGFI
jgi:hypothetical protein